MGTPAWAHATLLAKRDSADRMSDGYGCALRRAVARPWPSTSARRSGKSWAPQRTRPDVDPTGQEITFCCMVARLRDLARAAPDAGARRLLEWPADCTAAVGNGGDDCHSGQLPLGRRADRPYGLGLDAWLAAGEDGASITVDPGAVSNPPAIRPERKSLKRLGCAPACSGGNNGGYIKWYPQNKVLLAIFETEHGPILRHYLRCELSLRLRPGLKTPNNGGLFAQSS